MKKILDFIGWISFIVILFAYTMASFLPGVFAANYLQAKFQLPGLWCLVWVLVIVAVDTPIAMFLVLGLKKFGENQ